MNRSFLCIIVLLFHHLVFSQVVNIENRRLGDGSYGFSGTMNLNFSAQQQKDVLLSMNIKPMIQYKFNDKKNVVKDSVVVDSTDKKHIIKRAASYKHLILLLNDLTYTGAKGVTYANYGMSHLRYAYRIGESDWNWESYTQIQYNQLLLQKVRYLLGSGFRVKMFDIKPSDKNTFKEQQVKMYAGTSLFYEYEEINYSFRPIDYENAIRWSTYLSSYFNFKYFELTSTTYIQPNILNFKDVEFSGEYSILFRVSEPFSVKFTINHYFDTKPPETVQAGTFFFSVGFEYKLDKYNFANTRKWFSKIKTNDEKKPPEFDVN